MATILTPNEMRAFQTLFGKYCKQETSLEHCEPDCCDDCPVSRAYTKIFNEQNGNKASRTMRLPTRPELSTMAHVVNGMDSIMHWEFIFSWCKESVLGWEDLRMTHGWMSACYWSNSPKSSRIDSLGFRPTFEALDTDTMEVDGAFFVVGTLYMNGQPVRIPQTPTWDGDITNYEPDAKLELRKALDSPDYQVRAIKAGEVLIADRVLLKNISWEDLNNQGF